MNYVNGLGVDLPFAIEEQKKQGYSASLS